MQVYISTVSKLCMSNQTKCYVSALLQLHDCVVVKVCIFALQLTVRSFNARTEWVEWATPQIFAYAITLQLTYLSSTFKYAIRGTVLHSTKTMHANKYVIHSATLYIVFTVATSSVVAQPWSCTAILLGAKPQTHVYTVQIVQNLTETVFWYIERGQYIS